MIIVNLTQKLLRYERGLFNKEYIRLVRLDNKLFFCCDQFVVIMSFFLFAVRQK